jgi:uncharacterized protein (DUF4415 family)
MKKIQNGPKRISLAPVPHAKAYLPVLYDALTKKLRGQRGPQKGPTKVAITLRVDRDVVDRFKAAGPGWQTRMNEALGRAAKRQTR